MNATIILKKCLQLVEISTPAPGAMVQEAHQAVLAEAQRALDNLRSAKPLSVLMRYSSGHMAHLTLDEIEYICSMTSKDTLNIGAQREVARTLANVAVLHTNHEYFVSHVSWQHP